MRHAKHLESRPPVGRGGRAPAILVRVDDRLVVLVVRVNPLHGIKGEYDTASRMGTVRGVAHGVMRGIVRCTMRGIVHGTMQHHTVHRTVRHAAWTVQCTCSVRAVRSWCTGHCRVPATVQAMGERMAQWVASSSSRANGVAACVRQASPRLCRLCARSSSAASRLSIPAALL